MENFKNVELQKLADAPEAAAEGKRLLKLVFRNKSGDAEKQRESLYCEAPAFSEAELSDLLAFPAVREWARTKLEDFQKDLFRSAWEKAGEPGSYGFDFGVGTLVDAIKEENSRERTRTVKFSAKVVGAWFAEDMEGPLLAALQEKGITAADKLAEITAVYEATFKKLTARVPSVNTAQREQLVKCLMLLPEDYSSEVVDTLAAKITAAEKAEQQIENLL